jgi:heterodisulfide reductase subunit A
MSEKNENGLRRQDEEAQLECGEPGRDEAARVERAMEAARRQEAAEHQPEEEKLRIGVYICRCGGNISDVVDVERVAETVRLIPGVATAKVHTFVCSDPGQQTISNDILEENLDRVVVASCSPFLHEQTFRGAVARGGMNPYLYEHVNIREQASWAHKHDPAGATDKAIRMIAAAVGKLHHAAPLEQIKLPNHRRALVIGGGIAGMKAAADLAGRGIRVLLVEVSERLGGRLNERGAVYPSERSGDELVADLERRVRRDPNIEVLVSSQVTAVSGFIGNFKVQVQPVRPDAKARVIDTTVGAIVMATGFRPYVPRNGEFLYKNEPCVVTMPEFIQLMRSVKPDARTLTFGKREIRKIAFLHCVGSRQLDGVHEPQPDGKLNTYCSRTCCTTILQQALTVRERFPQIEVFDFYRDIRTYGRGEEAYYTEASKSGVVFFRYNGEEPPRVESAPAGRRARDGAVSITVKDTLTWGEELTLGVDMLVLGTGMTPGPIEDLIGQMKLPTGEDGFLQEVHPKLRPVELSVNGVLLAGTAQGPMNIQETLAAAGAAAVKAAAMFAKDNVELNPYVAAVDLDLCRGEAQCVTQCDYDGALTMVPMEVGGEMVERAQVNAGLCVGCGACVAVCPHRAIDLNGWRLDQYEAMVDGIAADIPGHECAADLVSIH